MTLALGLVAHVDSGKTTLAEGILYTCGKKRTLGRVDHGDTLLDDRDIERERGITVFAKEAGVRYKEVDITLLDTPGHVDFSAEMERTLGILDTAVLLIGANDNITGHTLTLWRLLNTYRIPTVIFVNKTDLIGTDRSAIYESLKGLSDNIVDFSYAKNDKDEFYEELSLCSEDMLNEYLENAHISDEKIRDAFQNRELFPCIFGSALKLDGIDELLDLIVYLKEEKTYPDEFSAKVYKISRDSDNVRLTHMRITGGTLNVKDRLGDEKVDQIQIHNGSGYENVSKAYPGQVCVISGIKNSKAGMIYGKTESEQQPLLMPVLSYKVIPDDSEDVNVCLERLKTLSDELPELNVTWQESHSEIHISVMGDVQTDIVKRIYHDRYGKDIKISEGSIVYKETIVEPVEGIGHYEPLKHYAEAHLYIEPLERGSGLEFASDVSTDELDLNWVRLILTHLKEKQIRGVLTGSMLTDARITVIGGKAHTKHTEGGDFRQATYRALRQGLMSAKSILLEPYMEFVLRVPTESLGRAMSDIQRYDGSFEPPYTENELSILKGTAPVATMFNYSKELSSYSKGMGSIDINVTGYRECHNTQEVMERISYDPEADVNDPSSSVFCAHGAGFIVPWYEVGKHAHVDCSDKINRMMGTSFTEDNEQVMTPVRNIPDYTNRERTISGEEIEQIFKDVYHKSGEELLPYRDMSYFKKEVSYKKPEKEYVYKPLAKKDSYLLVDGYNVIFADEKLSNMAKDNIDSARDALIDICCDYQGSKGMNLILVFDAYKVKGNPGTVQKFNNIHIVYTKEAETADQYIEKTVHEMAHKKNYDIMVATSDRLEQVIIYGEGAVRISSREFMEDVKRERERLRSEGYIS
ncbi:MAG: TetM/TetW/TetO/TetS family tetracycline resistance ribosomal protection protein [Lachnospiraceae bacterium]|nr:TetM/TetW/TetO/TetS family tetracycline resistance ribosomal protection protein [Lachnospiraceae bacterium]